MCVEQDMFLWFLLIRWTFIWRSTLSYDAHDIVCSFGILLLFHLSYFPYIKCLFNPKQMSFTFICNYYFILSKLRFLNTFDRFLPLKWFGQMILISAFLHQKKADDLFIFAILIKKEVECAETLFLLFTAVNSKKWVFLFFLSLIHIGR